VCRGLGKTKKTEEEEEEKKKRPAGRQAREL